VFWGNCFQDSSLWGDLSYGVYDFVIICRFLLVISIRIVLGYLLPGFIMLRAYCIQALVLYLGILGCFMVLGHGVFVESDEFPFVPHVILVDSILFVWIFGDDLVGLWFSCQPSASSLFICYFIGCGI